MSRRYVIEWPNTDEARWVIHEWWTLETEERWAGLPESCVIVGENEMKQWLKDNWEIGD